MDWKTLFSTFGLIFLAEMGDKTQLAVLTMTTKSKSPLAVFLGATAALTVVSGLAVLLGGVISRYVPETVLHKLVATAFIAIGLWMFFGKD
jgi:Ca2+/H+ antiporter, TMEM165/GDT1 family